MKNSDFHILTDYEIGRCIMSVMWVVRSGKPIVEIASRSLQSDHEKGLLEEDLLRCVDLSGEVATPFIIENEPSRWSYGFYLHPWALDAYVFLYQENGINNDYHRQWVAGLLFGYDVSAIQRFIAESHAPIPSSQQYDSDHMEERFPLPTTQSHNRNDTSWSAISQT